MDSAQRRQIARALRATAIAIARKSAPGVSLDLRKPVTVDDRLIESLKSDLRKMTRLYKSIPSTDSPEARKQFWHVRDLFHTFHDNVHDLVFKQILHNKKDWEAQHTLREKTGNFLAALKSGGWQRGSGTMFPTRYQEGGRGTPDFSHLARFQAQNIRRYQGAAREFFEWLEWWADLQGRLGKSATAPAVVETTNIGGFPIVIHKGDEKEWMESWGKTYDESLTRVLPAIRYIAQKMKQAGLDQALRTMTIHINFNEKAGGDAAGDYDRWADKLTIYPWGFTDVKTLERVLIHEIGHRFYYRHLNQKAIEHWEQTIRDKRAWMTEEAVDAWVDEVIVPLHAANPSYSVDDVARKTEQVLRGRDEVTQARYRHLAMNASAGREPEQARDSMKTFHGKDPVLVEYVTDYGATKPEETFAEAFQLYIIKGPRRLGPWTRQFFKEITRSGGAQVRSSVVQAKIQRPPRDIEKQLKIAVNTAKGLKKLLSRPEMADLFDYYLSDDPAYLVDQIDRYLGEVPAVLAEYESALDKKAEDARYFPFSIVQLGALDYFLKWSIALPRAVKASKTLSKSLQELLDNIAENVDPSWEPEKNKDALQTWSLVEQEVRRAMPAMDIQSLASQLEEFKRLQYDKALPAHEDIETLYHASTNAAEIARKGFSKEVPRTGGLGGSQQAGGDKRGISFTHDLHAAKEIARALKEVVMIANGQYTGPQLVRHIKAERGTWDTLIEFMKRTEGERPVADTLANLHDPKKVFWLYKKYLQQSRYRFDPIFFGARLDDFKGINPRNVGVVVADVNMKHPDVRFVPSEKEVRVPPEAVVKVKKLIR